EERPEERRALGGDSGVLGAEKEEEVGRIPEREDREARDVGVKARRQALGVGRRGRGDGGRRRRILAHEGGEDEEREDSRDRRDRGHGAPGGRGAGEESEGGGAPA